MAEILEFLTRAEKRVADQIVRTLRGLPKNEQKLQLAAVLILTGAVPADIVLNAWIKERNRQAGSQSNTDEVQG